MRLCVFGGASDVEGYLELGEALGRAMARRGWGLVFGGGGHGLMGAAARGVRAGGGEIIGVAPRFFQRPGVLFHGCTELILTQTMAQRKTRMEELGDAFLALPGGVGTLEEFFEVLTLRQLGRHEKPIAVLDAAGYYRPLEELLAHSVRTGFTPASTRELYGVFTDPEESLRYLEERLAR